MGGYDEQQPIIKSREPTAVCLPPIYAPNLQMTRWPILRWTLDDYDADDREGKAYLDKARVSKGRPKQG